MIWNLCANEMKVVRLLVKAISSHYLQFKIVFLVFLHVIMLACAFVFSAEYLVETEPHAKHQKRSWDLGLYVMVCPSLLFEADSDITSIDSLWCFSMRQAILYLCVGPQSLYKQRNQLVA